MLFSATFKTYRPSPADASPAITLVLYDAKRDRYIRHNKSRCRTRFSPKSTFKIPNSLIGLEIGVIRDLDFAIG